MPDLEQQLRQLKFRSPSPELKRRILVPRDRATSHKQWYLASSLACIWLLIALFYFTTPATPTSSGPPISYAEFRRATLMTKLQIVMLENEGRLPDCDGPTFAAPKHF